MFVPIGILVLSTIQYASTNFTFPSRQSDTSTNTSRDPGVNLSPNVNLGNEVSGEGRNLFNYDPGTSPGGPPREGKHLFNWLDDIVTPERDPYIKKLNDGCLEERHKLKKLIIPLLIVLKLFKLKLLLFLPLILGLAGFKKVLGLLAIAIPGLIGYFKFCRPQNYGTFGHSNFYSAPLFDDIASEVDILEDKKDNLIKTCRIPHPNLQLIELTSFTTFIIPKVLLRIHHHIVRCLNQKDSEFPILTPNSSFSL
ncbi:uncharacterized protein LOC103515409 [Diaphorina citri]|uniref:Uncharacterized protein LOC103515409 n=1 Tax=Diaphorina citri TaxID=121845 RepID=A0A3Q0J618_DIACI|nr:uncharacterized protein LOC103515409 [Diaphorina citri]